MFIYNRIVLLFIVITALSSSAAAFFLNWGASDSTVKNQPQQWPVTTYYHQQRLIQPGATYTIQGAEQPLPVQIPAIPIQVPLQAQFSPAANVHNVQLVPCLCPVSQEFEYDSKPQETTFISPKQPQK